MVREKENQSLVVRFDPNVKQMRRFLFAKSPSAVLFLYNLRSACFYMYNIWFRLERCKYKWHLPVCGVKGQPFGTVVAMSCSGLIAASAGWPWVFYATGALGLFTSALWILLAADSPAQHKLTSPQERNYIEKSIGVQCNTAAQDADKVRQIEFVDSLCFRFEIRKKISYFYCQI